MTKLELNLGGLLIVQLILAATIYLFFNEDQGPTESKPLITELPENIDLIEIDSGDQKVSLKLKNGTWKIDGDKNITAQKSKVESALNKLAALKTRWPVTTSESSHERFEVANDKYQKKIVLFNDGKKADEIILGTSPSFKQVHLRRGNDNNIFAASLNSYDFPAQADSWLDRNQISAKNIKAIENDSFSISKSDENWQWTANTNKEIGLNTEKAENLAKALSTLSVQGLAEKSPDFNSEDTVSIGVKGDSHWKYLFLKDENDYFVKRSDSDATFKLSQYEYDRIAKYSFDELKLETVKDSIADSGSNLNEKDQSKQKGGEDSTGH